MSAIRENVSKTNEYVLKSKAVGLNRDPYTIQNN